MGRKKIKVKRGLVGSSDISRVKSMRAILELNHKELEESNLNTSFMAIKVEAKPLVITEEYLLRTYKEVKVLGEWDSLRDHIGSLVTMYNDNYQMR